MIANALYISSYQVACSCEALRRHQITHIVNTAADICENNFVGEFRYLTYYLKDTNNEDISVLFYRTLSWIHDAIQRQGRVLVHCREGVSRSATMVIAYLMWRFMMPFEAAHDAIRKARPICNPNTGFTCQLLRFGKKLGVGLSSQAGALPACDGPVVSRIVAHHARAPFPVLVPMEWPGESSARSLDGRFGWVIQRGAHWVLWIGARAVSEEAEAAVQQHAAWAETFERCRYTLAVVHEGKEQAQFWSMLDMLPPTADRAAAFSAPRSAFDADAEVRLSCGQAEGCDGRMGSAVLPASPRALGMHLDAPCTRSAMYDVREVEHPAVGF